jgi:chemotaxis protein histidine kinase CheA
MEDTQEIVEQEVEQQPEAQVEQKSRGSQEQNWQKANEIMSYQQRQIEELQKQLSAPKVIAPVEEPDEFDKLDGDDLLTVKQARALAEKQAKRAARQTYDEIVKENEIKSQKEVQARKAQEHQVKMSKLDQFEKDMRDAHDDFDDIVDNFALPLMNKNPAYKQLVFEADDPAQEAYILGQMIARRNGKIAAAPMSPKAEKIVKNATRPLSGNAIGAPNKGQKDTNQMKPGSDVWEMSQKYARAAI